MRKTFTYYCGTHRTQTAKGPGPTTGLKHRQYCPVCDEQMYYVPNGATEIPAPLTRTEAKNVA